MRVKTVILLVFILQKILDSKIIKISDWKNIFSTKKCLSVELTKNLNFAASGGGRIAKLDDEQHIIYNW